MILLISPYQGILNENIGIQQISAFLLEKKINNKVIYLNTSNDILEEISHIDINGVTMVGVSLYGDNFEFAKTLSRTIKAQSNLPIFYGSQFATLSYKFILENDPHVDFIVLGQGEYPIWEFVKLYNGSNMADLVKMSPNLVSRESAHGKKPYKTAISNLPWPNHDKSIIRKNFFTYLNTSQGCLGNCSFCGSLRNKWSGRTPKEIREEVLKLYQTYGVRAFSFSDCSFEDPGQFGKKRLYEWVECMREINIPFAFQAFLRADSFFEEDEVLLRSLKEIGLNQYVIGIESGNQSDLCVYGKRASLSDNIRTLSLLRKLDIFAFIGFIMVNPFSTFTTLHENYEFLCEYHGFFPASFTNQLILYDNTRLFHIVKENKQLICLDNHHFDYFIKDEYVQTLKQEFFPTIGKSGLSNEMIYLQSDLRLINFLFALIKDTDRERERLKTTLAEMKELNCQFYKSIYLEQEISFANKTFDEYHKCITHACDHIRIIKRIMQKQYLSGNTQMPNVCDKD